MFRRLDPYEATVELSTMLFDRTRDASDAHREIRKLQAEVNRLKVARRLDAYLSIAGGY